MISRNKFYFPSLYTHFIRYPWLTGLKMSKTWRETGFKFRKRRGQVATWIDPRQHLLWAAEECAGGFWNIHNGQFCCKQAAPTRWEVIRRSKMEITLNDDSISTKYEQLAACTDRAFRKKAAKVRKVFAKSAHVRFQKMALRVAERKFWDHFYKPIIPQNWWISPWNQSFNRFGWVLRRYSVFCLFGMFLARF